LVAAHGTESDGIRRAGAFSKSPGRSYRAPDAAGKQEKGHLYTPDP
jgi:hypothetical protein